MLGAVRLYATANSVEFSNKTFFDSNTNNINMRDIILLLDEEYTEGSSLLLNRPDVSVKVCSLQKT
jgi:hypothetical protein